MGSTNRMSIIFRQNLGLMGQSQSPFGHESHLGAMEKIIRWPCLLARVFGYWPFYHQIGLLRFKWLQTGPLFTLITSSAIIALYIYVNSFRKKTFGSTNENLLHTKNSTEDLGQRIIVAFQTLAVFFLHFAVMYSRDGIVKTFNDLKATLEQALRLEIVDDRVIIHAQRRVRTALITCFVIGLVRTGALFALAGLPTFKKLDFWEACAFSGAFALWSFLMPTITAWLVVLYGLILVVSGSFEILLAQGSSSSVPAFRKMIASSKSNKENIVQIGRRLRGIVEDFNEYFKVPLVGIFMLMIVIMTISIFFAANGMDQGLHLLVCVLTFTLYMIVFYFLCSAGEALVRHATRYGEVLGARAADGPNSFHIQYESLKMTTEPPAVSPGLYCTLRSQLLSSIIGVLTSYSIILVQFKTSEEQSTSCQPSQ